MSSWVSVIIPNLNSLVVDRTLVALRDQRFSLARVEILVVGLDEPGLVRTDRLVRMISTETPVPPAVARNVGVQEAKGDLLCFIDADCIPHQDWLEKLLSHYNNLNVTVVGGGVAFPTDGYWRLADNVATFYPYLHTSLPGTRDQLPSLNLSFRREVWDEVGIFDERYPYPAGEDADWSTRARLAGHQLYFEPGATVTHCPARATLRDLWQHAVRFGQYSVKVDKRYQARLALPFVLRHWLLVLLATPIMAAFVTGRVLFNRYLWRYAYTLPAVYIAKVGWCWGASKRLRGQVTWYCSQVHCEEKL
jgi:glycosyltransferase involved in cell wall biosynthesis